MNSLQRSVHTTVTYMNIPLKEDFMRLARGLPVSLNTLGELENRFLLKRSTSGFYTITEEGRRALTIILREK